MVKPCTFLVAQPSVSILCQFWCFVTLCFFKFRHSEHDKHFFANFFAHCKPAIRSHICSYFFSCLPKYFHCTRCQLSFRSTSVQFNVYFHSCIFAITLGKTIAGDFVVYTLFTNHNHLFADKQFGTVFEFLIHFGFGLFDENFTETIF